MVQGKDQGEGAQSLLTPRQVGYVLPTLLWRPHTEHNALHHNAPGPALTYDFCLGAAAVSYIILRVLRQDSALTTVVAPNSQQQQASTVIAHGYRPLRLQEQCTTVACPFWLPRQSLSTQAKTKQMRHFSWRDDLPTTVNLAKRPLLLSHRGKTWVSSMVWLIASVSLKGI